MARRVRGIGDEPDITLESPVFPSTLLIAIGATLPRVPVYPDAAAMDSVEHLMSRTVQLVLVVLLVLLLLGALPLWPYSSHWGYFPAGGLGLLVIILLVVILAGADRGSPRLP